MYGKKKKYLKGGQAKLDMNKDGKLSGADFKMLGNKNKKMMMGGKMNADKEFMYGGTFKKLDQKEKDQMFNSFSGAIEAKFGRKKPKREKKMMKGGKMNYGSGGYHQHD